MKKILLLLLISFLLTSCGKIEEQGMMEETGQIMNNYVDTLEGSIQDAKDAKKLIEKNQQKLKDNLNVY